MDASYQFGIEEEYFLADAATRGTPRRRVAAFHAAAQARLPAAERELLQSQIEVSSEPSTSFETAREALGALRAGLAEVGRDHGVLVLAAGTHPLARWSRQSQTQKGRYDEIMAKTRITGRRSVVCGMHVHVEVPRPEARVDLMNRLLPAMPLLLALSASSPFWQGRATGMAAYRMSVFGEMPRSGLPDLFDGPEDYARYVDAMTRAGSIQDASFLWWTLRPSIRYPTLELRVADSCTLLAHTLAIAALYRCLVRLADRRPEWNRGLTGASRALVAENLWRAQSDGVRAELIDVFTGEARPFAACLHAVLEEVAEDADALGCAGEAAVARDIVAGGTSADRQAAAFDAARGRGLDEREATGAVVDWLARATAGAEA